MIVIALSVPVRGDAFSELIVIMSKSMLCGRSVICLSSVVLPFFEMEIVSVVRVVVRFHLFVIVVECVLWFDCLCNVCVILVSRLLVYCTSVCLFTCVCRACVRMRVCV